MRGPYDPDWPTRIARGDAGKYGLHLEPEEMVRVETRDASHIILAVKNVWTPSIAEMQRRKKARQKARQARIAADQAQVRQAREIASFYQSIAQGRAEADRSRGR
jgi:hypothetical protein